MRPRFPPSLPLPSLPQPLPAPLSLSLSAPICLPPPPLPHPPPARPSPLHLFRLSSPVLHLFTLLNACGTSAPLLLRPWVRPLCTSSLQPSATTRSLTGFLSASSSRSEQVRHAIPLKSAALSPRGPATAYAGRKSEKGCQCDHATHTVRGSKERRCRAHVLFSLLRAGGFHGNITRLLACDPEDLRTYRGMEIGKGIGRTFVHPNYRSTHSDNHSSISVHHFAFSP
mgnify:CR=1 FL=1